VSLRVSVRIALLVMVAAIAIFTVACGDDDDDGNASNQDTAAAEPAAEEPAAEEEAGASEAVMAEDVEYTVTKASEEHQIAVVLGSRTGPWPEAEMRGANKAADELGVEVDISAPAEWDATQQADVVGTALNKQPAFMVVQPADAETMIPPLDAANQQGIAMVTIDTFIGDGVYGTDEPGAFPLTFVGSNNYDGGVMGCEALAEKIGNKGKVYIQDNTPGASSTADRTKGCMSVLEQHPDIEVVGKQFGEEDPAKAQAQTETIMQKHPDLAGIFANAGFVSEGAANAVRTQGKENDVAVVMFDATPANIDLLKNKTAFGVVAQRPALMGEVGVRLAVEFLEGNEDLPTMVDTGMQVVTQDNIDEVDLAEITY
jgi:ribose transport system substrate-binding protein